MNADQQKMIKSFYAPLFFVFLLWMVKLVENYYSLDFAPYGLYPREPEGLRGIFTMPFIHQDYKHLFSNSIPLIILGASVIYFYEETAGKVFLLVYLLDGFWLWLGGRDSYHIGARGIVYGLASFLFFSGIFRRYIRLMAISMLVTFLYGGMVWGLFPIFIGVSWEAHLFAKTHVFDHRRRQNFERCGDKNGRDVSNWKPTTVVTTVPLCRRIG